MRLQEPESATGKGKGKRKGQGGLEAAVLLHCMSYLTLDAAVEVPESLYSATPLNEAAFLAEQRAGEAALGLVIDIHRVDKSTLKAAKARSKQAEQLWSPDAKGCMRCEATFSVRRRRHHCRQCGKVVCGGCSGNHQALPSRGYLVAVRVCDGCYDSPNAAEATEPRGAKAQRHRVRKAGKAAHRLFCDGPAFQRAAQALHLLGLLERHRRRSSIAGGRRGALFPLGATRDAPPGLSLSPAVAAAVLAGGGPPWLETEERVVRLACILSLKNKLRSLGAYTSVYYTYEYIHTLRYCAVRLP
jgi:hypothetical protein